jgi:hypothetical protein
MNRGWRQRELAQQVGLHLWAAHFRESQQVPDLHSWGVKAKAKALG